VIEGGFFGYRVTVQNEGPATAWDVVVTDVFPVGTSYIASEVDGDSGSCDRDLTAEFFVDVFNLFDDQAAIRIEDLVAGTGTTKFGDEIQWVNPRRALLGARIRF
jgi:uncharacterized repeat protein (TIGR01451 family)